MKGKGCVCVCVSIGVHDRLTAAYQQDRTGMMCWLKSLLSYHRLVRGVFGCLAWLVRDSVHHCDLGEGVYSMRGGAWCVTVFITYTLEWVPWINDCFSTCDTHCGQMNIVVLVGLVAVNLPWA